MGNYEDNEEFTHRLLRRQKNPRQHEVGAGRPMEGSTTGPVSSLYAICLRRQPQYCWLRFRRGMIKIKHLGLLVDESSSRLCSKGDAGIIEEQTLTR